MFGFTTKERLFRLILDSSKNASVSYKDNIMRVALEFEDVDESELEQIRSRIRKEYLDDVFGSVAMVIRAASPIIFERFRLATQGTHLCGYPDGDTDNGIMAGLTYAIAYFAITNKTAKPADCIAMNHLQYEIMELALFEVDERLHQNGAKDVY